MYNIEELKEKLKELRNSIDNGMLIPITNITKVVLDDTIHLINSLEKKEEFENNKIDVTKEYENMIHAFECDFAIAFNYGDYNIFDDLRRLYEDKNKRLLKDTEKLKELCFLLRYGKAKIYKINE